MRVAASYAARLNSALMSQESFDSDGMLACSSGLPNRLTWYRICEFIDAEMSAELMPFGRLITMEE